MADSDLNSNSSFHSLYENLVFDDIRGCETNISASSKAHTQRKIISQLYCSSVDDRKCEDPFVALSLHDQHLQRYCQIIDNQDPVKGLNNYSKGALSLCSSFKNESKLWSLKDVRTTSSFQQLENDLRRESLGNPLIADLERTLDYVKTLDTRSEEKKPEPITFNMKKEPKQDLEMPKSSPFSSSRVNFPSRPPERKPEEPIAPQRPNTAVYRHVSKELPSPTDHYRIPEKKVDEPVSKPNTNAFRTAKEQLIVDQKKKNSGGNSNNNPPAPTYGSRPKSLGPRRGLNSPFILPIKGAQSSENENNNGSNEKSNSNNEVEKITDERLKNIEPKMVELIENEIMDTGSPVNWDDIAGLEFAKKTIKEIVVWPMLRPDIFTGLRGPPRGILLFGPPGTGKTLIGKCIASQSKSTFFSISASTLTSKWVGEGEKMVRALFAVARVQQPSVIFIDEIDSLLSQRSDTEHESSRRMKTEFLVQLDGATTSQEDRLLVVGATNRPQELDEAARRRLVKRLYIPLPEFSARKQIIQLLMAPQRHILQEDQVDVICQRTDGYSCADMTNLCKEAAYGPIRSINFQDIEHISPDQVRPISNEDFESALCQVRASVSTQDLALYEDWNGRYGSGAK